MGVPYAEVIGDPVAHSRSPEIHKFWLEKLGINAEYRATRVTSAELPDYLAGRRADPDWCGCNVTMPLKRAALPLVDDHANPVATIGAVNTIVRGPDPARLLTGHNTDVAGFLEPLGDWPGPDKIYRIANVIGTGGAAAAASFGLKQRRFLLITIGQTLVSATLFQQRHGDRDPDFVAVLADYATPPDPPWQWTHLDVAADLLVNATPLGMAGHAPLAFDLANLAPGAIVYDLVTAPVETDLIRRARAGGHRVITGIEMLIAQAAEAFTLLFGFGAPREHDEELMDRLTS